MALDELDFDAFLNGDWLPEGITTDAVMSGTLSDAELEITARNATYYASVMGLEQLCGGNLRTRRRATCRRAVALSHMTATQILLLGECRISLFWDRDNLDWIRDAEQTVMHTREMLSKMYRETDSAERLVRIFTSGQ